MTIARGTLLLLVAFAFAGCVLPGLKSQAGSPEDEPPETRLTVLNLHWSDVDVFVLRGTERVRLGFVTSMQSADFILPPDVANCACELRLMADPVGGDPFVSESVWVEPGDEIEWQLTKQAAALEPFGLAGWCRAAVIDRRGTSVGGG